VTTTDEMTCKELVEVVTDYLEGELSAVDRRRFEEHLEECPYCRIYLEQMRTTIRTLGRLSEESIPRDARAELLNAFRDWKTG
jgi:anti-sigma factor RsiW